MHRTIRNVGGWLAATAAAVGISWTVITDATGPTAAPPISVIPITGSPPPLSPGTTGTSPATSNPATSAPASPPVPQSPSPTTTSSAAVASGLRSHRVSGGQVVLELTRDRARLVSVVPADGYRARTWQADGWLRVDFTAGDRSSSVFATWNGHPPSVQTVEY